MDSHGLTCPHCGYDLTGLRDPRCPACGTRIDPYESARKRFRRARDRSARWSMAVGVIPIAVAACLHLFQGAFTFTQWALAVIGLAWIAIAFITAVMDAMESR